MLRLSQYSLIASLVVLGLALLCYIIVLAFQRSAKRQAALAPSRVRALAPVGGRGGRAGAAGTPTQPGPADAMDGGAGASVERAPAQAGLADYGTYFTWLGLAFLTASLVFRGFGTGHGPFTNQYEYSVSFAWGIVAAYSYLERRYRARMVGLPVLAAAISLLLYALFAPGADNVNLVPALQNNLLLTLHVGAAIIAYGAFAVACAAGVLYLLQPDGGRRGWPKLAVLDELSYRAVVIGFPMHTLMLILGAVWADIAWGSYWSWDPKETASLVTWLIYGAYLHARVVRGWRGRKAAWLLMLGFAAVIFTFLGNLFFNGQHSYGSGRPN